jgi:hypothetical protein
VLSAVAAGTTIWATANPEEAIMLVPADQPLVPRILPFITVLSLTAAAVPGAGQTSASKSSQSTAWMRHHFAEVLVLHDAVVRGDLTSARASARRVAAEPDPPKLTDAGRARVARIRAMASDVEAAKSIETAAAATSGMVATCGDCHVAMGTRMPPPPLEAPKRDVGGLVGHMLTHRQGLESLMAGLLIPSSSTWAEGARQLQGAALSRRDLPDDPKLNSRVANADKQVHALAERAAQAATSDARVAVYGELLATCATCHSLHPSVWGPAR